MNKMTKFLAVSLFLISYFPLYSQDYRAVFYEKINHSNELAFAYCDSLLTSKKPTIRAFAYGKRDYFKTERKFLKKRKGG